MWVLAALLAPAACNPPVVVDGGDAASEPDAGNADAAGTDAIVGRDAALPDVGSRDASYGLAAVGSAARLDLGTWNIVNFPVAGDTTVDLVARILFDLQVDLIAVQEITDLRDFAVMLSLLPGYSGRVSSDSYGFQRPGVVYRTGMFEISDVQLLFDSDNTSFPRAPFQFDVDAVDPQGSAHYQFTMIVVHLKAGSTSADEDARRSALAQLKTHLDQERTAQPDRDFVLLGDFNDQLTDGAADNVFQPFLDDSAHYRFLDRALAQSGEDTYIGYSGTMIDHILVADQDATDFAGDSTRVLHLDEQIANYEATVSDHRMLMTSIDPVAWR
jgi:endonuclease/exonuclease/phosphatase family metal-dependent hydrolase